MVGLFHLITEGVLDGQIVFFQNCWVPEPNVYRQHRQRGAIEFRYSLFFLRNFASRSVSPIEYNLTLRNFACYGLKFYARRLITL